jgi:putative tryptophan/tyrosine transport system substrate-binding protein
MTTRRIIITGLGGAAAAWPLAGRALAQQPAKPHRIAIVSGAPVTDMNENSGVLSWPALFAQLRRLGFVEGQNLVVERYSFLGLSEPFAELAADVVRRKPDLIVATTSRMVQTFKETTAVIPIVSVTADPLAQGLVTSLARPEGNITGVSVTAGLEVLGKQLGLLKELLPILSKAGFLAKRSVWEGPPGTALRAAAQRMGIVVVGAILEVAQEPEYRRVFAMLKQEAVDGLVVSDQSENFTHRRLIIELAANDRLLAIYAYRQQAEIGGLMSYGPDVAEVFRIAATQVGRILKGARPADLPIEQPTRFEMVLNMKTARALGLTIPPLVLAQADEVIE